MKFKNALGAFVAVVLVMNQFFSYGVYAQEFTVSGNGEGSTNSINFEETNTDTISQENNADINNNVDASAETGNNEANGNSGETSIETGNIEEEITVINSGNSSQAEIGCCANEDPSSVSIEDNGSDSENNIGIMQDSSNKINIVNELQLTNNVSLYSNTGDNEANDNDGNVEIQTGEINLLAQILNQNLNSAKVSASNQNPSFAYNISGNGSGSTNSIKENNNTGNEYLVFNTLYLNNNIKNYSNTGGNKANKNIGNVFISTGSVLLDIILSNRDINSSKITSTCCNGALPPSPPPSGSPTPSPSGTPSPSDPPSGGPQPTSSCCSPTTDIPGPGGGGGGTGGGGGEILGASLPATGGFSLWFLTGMALLMIASGVILRSDYEKNALFKRFKKLYGEFVYNLRATAFGVYLFANLKVIPSLKT